MIDVSIEIQELSVTATHADIVDNHTDVMQMLMTIYVGLFNDSGDRLKVISIEHQLTEFPIPSLEEQWAIVMPKLDELQHPAP